MRVSSFLAAALAAVSVEAQVNGFNYGTTFTDGSAKVQSDFEAEFNKAKSLAGTNGRFTSARLYTMIQAGTTNTPVSAIPAAINTQTRLLLGLWASAGQSDFNNELAALSSAITQYGTAFTDLIDGISVGSEDLYRNSPTGITNNNNLNEGAQPSTIVDFIGQTRKVISGTAASGAKVGHVDTWTAWVNGSNFAVTSACDWLGMDAYPYFQTTMDNSITVANSTFYDALDATIADAQGKPVWVTETGWPVSGATLNQAVASIPNAETYWQEVQCSLHDSRNMWWYTLQDAAPTTPNPSFGIIGSDLSSAPLYNLACSNAASSSTSSSSAATSSTKSAVSTASSATAPASSGAPNTESLSAATPGPQTSPTGVSSSALQQTTVTSAAASSSKAASSTGAASTSEAVSTIVTPVSSATTTVVGGKTHTIYTTTLVTITSCPSECTATTMTTVASQSSAPAQTTSTAPAASGSSCPANLQGSYQYPHLIVPVNSQQPSKAYGSQYNGTITPAISSIFNFDIPQSYSGKTCSLVFLFPTQSELETSSFDLNGKGGISVDELSSPATQQTTYSTVPAAAVAGIGSISNVQPGNSYVVASHQCAAGKTQSFEFKSTGGLDLTYFQDYNPSPIGAYITSC